MAIAPSSLAELVRHLRPPLVGHQPTLYLYREWRSQGQVVGPVWAYLPLHRSVVCLSDASRYAVGSVVWEGRERADGPAPERKMESPCHQPQFLEFWGPWSSEHVWTVHSCDMT